MKNLSVRLKLMAGFAAMLLVMVVIALIGLSNINEMKSRAERLMVVNGIIDEVNKVQTNRLRYEQFREPRYLQAVNTALEHIQGMIDSRRGSYRLASSRALLDDAQHAMGRYSDSLKTLVAALQTGRTTDVELARGILEADFNTTFTAIQQLIEQQNALTGEQVISSQRDMIGWLLGGLLLGGIVSTLITRGIQQPLKEAVTFAERMGEGNLSAFAVAPRGDEFGALLRALELSGNNLRVMLGQVSDVTGELQSAAEELSAVTEQSRGGANIQRLETDQVAVAMNEMVTTVQHVALSAEQASRTAHVADEQARKGASVADDALVQIERLSAEIISSNKAVLYLSEESERIGGVLTVINGLASQTNLLALNAAIEAARAGEAGRGFAVVADEVRGLAQRTQESTAQIEALITSLQSSAQTAAQRMNSSCEMAAGTVSLTQAMQVELKGISREVAQIQSMNQQVASAAEQQGAVVEEINRNVHSIKDVTEQSAAATGQMAVAAVSLARQGSELRQLVGRFQL